MRLSSLIVKCQNIHIEIEHALIEFVESKECFVDLRDQNLFVFMYNGDMTNIVEVQLNALCVNLCGELEYHIGNGFDTQISSCEFRRMKTDNWINKYESGFVFDLTMYALGFNISCAMLENKL